MDKTKMRILAHMSSQTGDTLHVAGAMILDSQIHVIVVHAGEPWTNKGLLNFYRQVTDPGYPGADVEPDIAYTNQRVKAVYASNKEVARLLYQALSVKGTWDKKIENEFDKILAAGNLAYDTTNIGTAQSPSMEQIGNFSDFKTLFLPFPNNTYTYMGPLGNATSTIAEAFKTAKIAEDYKILYTKLAQKLTSRNLRSEDIIGGTIQAPKFGEHTLPDTTPSQTPVVLLWARYTGTNTAIAYNPGGDSCVQGQAQINTLLTKLNYNVITIGHGPRGSQPFRATFDVGEFYNQTPISGDRATQQSFFLALMEKYPGRLYQLGQKTGGMDGAALLGIPTLYLEHAKSNAIKRMEKWTDGTLPYYRCVVTKQPAPAVVLAMEGDIPEEKHPEDRPKIYSGKEGWRSSMDPLQRARARLVVMLYQYPRLMGKDEFAPENKETKKMKEVRFAKIVDFVKALPDSDLQEDMDDPAKDGVWTKAVQSVNQSMDIKQAGYSCDDRERIKAAIKELVGDYSAATNALLRTAGGYQTRADANL